MYLSYKQWVKARRDENFLKRYQNVNKPNVKIILNDFAQFPLYREKKILGSTIKCGIGNLFKRISKFKAGAEFGIILVINSTDDRETIKKKGIYVALERKYRFIEKIIFRDNVGFDFGAYNTGYQYLKSAGYKDDVLFMNSSVRGPYNNYWLLKYTYLFHRDKNIGLCGISINSHATHLKNNLFRPHVQSFFMYTNMNVLTKVFNDSLQGADINSKVPADIVSGGEIKFSERIIDHGYGICSKLFDDFIYFKGNAWTIPSGDTRFDEKYNYFANKI
jgi:hypothetical protein